MFVLRVRPFAFKSFWQLACASVLAVMFVTLLGVGAHAEDDTSAGTESAIGSNSATQVEEAVPSNASAAEASVVYEYTVTPLQAHPGKPVTVTGQCSDPRFATTDITADFNYLNFQEQEFYWSFTKELTVGPDGKFSEEIVVPAEAYPGDYSVGIICTSDDQAFHPDDTNTVLTVLGEVPTVPPGTTPTPTVPSVPTEAPVPTEATGASEELAETGGTASLALVWGAVAAGVLGVGPLARARYADRRARA